MSSGSWNFRDPYSSVRPSDVTGIEMGSTRNSRANSLNFAAYEAREAARKKAAANAAKRNANAAAQRALRNRMSQTAYGQTYLKRYGAPTRRQQRGGYRKNRKTRRRHQK